MAGTSWCGGDAAMSERQLRTLSLGAGVQSTAVYLLACETPVMRFDAAIFADTGWEPARVYEHLNRLEKAGGDTVPIYRVGVGNIRDDALDPEHRFASMPLFVRNRDGSDGMARRQCTSEYKLKPIKRKVRELLGHPHPNPVPKGVHAEVSIGISTDEIGRARDSDVQYMRNVFPLLDLGWSRKDCERYLASIGWAGVAKSACVGCPFHGNRQWRQMRDEHPDEWADAVAFDAAIRNGSARANAAGAPPARPHVPSPFPRPARRGSDRPRHCCRMERPAGRPVRGRRPGRLLTMGVPLRGGGQLMAASCVSLDDRLRAALHAEADAFVPAADGLLLIRRRMYNPTVPDLIARAAAFALSALRIRSRKETTNV